MEFLGFENVIDILKNVQGGKLAVIGSLPSLGKTSFALTLLKEITVTQNVSSILFSLEMSKSTLEKRMNEMDFKANENLQIFDDSKLSIEELSSILKNKDLSIKFCFIDYFGLFIGNDSISESIKNLKTLAMNNNVCIFILTQISKDYNDLVPELSHYESFSQYADLIIALHKNKGQEETKLLILKN